jgi:hypothetical protein
MLNIHTKAVGWQKRCWDWVKAGERFELHGVETPHLLFCNALCAAYKYQHEFSDPSVLAFFPGNFSFAAVTDAAQRFASPSIRL